MGDLLNMMVVLVFTMLSLASLVFTGLSCDFLTVNAPAGEMLFLLDGVTSRNEFVDQTTLGVFCDGDFYSLKEDTMAILSGAFASLAMVLGFMSLLLSLLIVCFRQPCKNMWMAASLAAAGSCMGSVPIFLLFESEPCTQGGGQRCGISRNGFILVGGILSWIIVVVVTQCQDAPNWTKQSQERLLSNGSSGKKPRDLSKSRKDKKPSIRKSNRLQQRFRRWFPLESESEDDLDLVETGMFKIDRTVSEEEDEAMGSQCALLSGAGNQIVFQPISEPRDMSSLDLSFEPSAGNNSRPKSPHYEPVRRNLVPFDLSQAADVDVQQRLTVPDSPVDDDYLRAMDDYSPPERKIFSTRALADSCLESDSDDLGSLEPSDNELTGYESMLDRTMSPRSALASPVTGTESILDDPSSPVSGTYPTSLLEEAKRLSPEKQGSAKDLSTTKSAEQIRAKVKQALLSPSAFVEKALAHGSLKRRIRKGYYLMDDTKIERSLPMSPPLEILTLNISGDDDLEMDLDDLSDTPDKTRSVAHTTSTTNIVSPEPEVSTKEVIDYPTFDFSVDPNPPPRTKRSRKRPAVQANHSLASGSSLLSLTIDEETMDDLLAETDNESIRAETYNPDRFVSSPVSLVKSRSAPNLAGFDSLNKSDGGRSYDDLKDTGINSGKRSAEVFLAPTKHFPTRESRSLGPGLQNQRYASALADSRTTRSLGALRRPPNFRDERALREGIHSTTNNASDNSSRSGSEDSHSSSHRRATIRKAREARIRRLQYQSRSPMSVRKLNMTRSLSPARTRKIDQAGVSTHSYHSQETGTPDQSIDSGSTGYMFDMMDVQLAELTREDGHYKGPDEVSV